MASKRANNEGTIRQRDDGRWEARYRDNQGIRRSLYSSSQADLVKKLREIRNQLDHGTFCAPENITLTSWMDTWWIEYCAPVNRKNSAATSRYTIESHIKPAIGRVKLQQLRPEHIQGFANRLVRNGYAPATIRRIMATLRTALRQAVTNNIIPRNPVEGIRLPKMEQEEVDHLTIDEQRKFLGVIPDNTYGRCLRFILGTGLRASEAIGLRWQDIQNDRFTVNQAITEYRDYESSEGPKVKRNTAPPKSTSSNRTIPLTASMLTLLADQRVAQLKEKETALADGLRWQSNGLVFSAHHGQPLDRHNLARTLRNALGQSGLPHSGIHSLRHTFATNAVQSGMDIRTLTEIIGHTKVAFTLQTYAHSDMDTKLKALQAMEADLG